MGNGLSKSDLIIFLNEKSNKYNNQSFIKTDPIQIPHSFQKKEDIEISAFLTSIISWGLRKTIIKNSYFLMEEFYIEDFFQRKTQRDQLLLLVLLVQINKIYYPFIFLK